MRLAASVPAAAWAVPGSVPVAFAPVGSDLRCVRLYTVELLVRRRLTPATSCMAGARSPYSQAGWRQQWLNCPRTSALRSRAVFRASLVRPGSKRMSSSKEVTRFWRSSLVMNSSSLGLIHPPKPPEASSRQRSRSDASQSSSGEFPVLCASRASTCSRYPSPRPETVTTIFYETGTHGSPPFSRPNGQSC